MFIALQTAPERRGAKNETGAQASKSAFHGI
jgi:hypothetical protein